MFLIVFVNTSWSGFMTLHLSPSFSLSFQLKKINILTLSVSLLFNMTEQDGSCHCLPYHVSVRFISVLVYGSFDQMCLKERISFSISSDLVSLWT